MKKISICLFLAFYAVAIFAQSNKSKVANPGIDAKGMTTVSHIADLKGIFPNPDRGWHNRRDLDGRGNDDRDFSDVVAAGQTLLHSYLRLDDFKEADQIPQSYLDKLQEALDAVRAHGLKIILRPTHVWDASKGYNVLSNSVIIRSQEYELG